jgi:hypothetical protein
MEPVDDYTVTDERAQLLAAHAIYVQGGFSTPEIEAERARKDMADGGAPIDWDKMRAELIAVIPTLPVDLPDAPLDQPADRVSSRDPVPGFDDAHELPPAEFDLDVVRRYNELRAQEKIASTEAKAIKDEADLLEMFSEAGLQNVNVDGKTVYLHRSTFAQRKEGVTAEDVKAGLRAAGAGELVTETVNANTLSAYVRELEEDGGPGLPPELVDILLLGERYAVRIRASRGTRAKHDQ